jgi:hypothetical protein
MMMMMMAATQNQESFADRAVLARTQGRARSSRRSAAGDHRPTIIGRRSSAGWLAGIHARLEAGQMGEDRIEHS